MTTVAESRNRHGKFMPFGKLRQPVFADMENRPGIAHVHDGDHRKALGRKFAALQENLGHLAVMPAQGSGLGLIHLDFGHRSGCHPHF
ncbi:MAG: hypothetical protein ACD_75C02076G0006 [uncultured bacterium]|nr:MAG: hypothetical protein ACD_75C02076G0006 [uncultured bacterium]